MKLELKPEEITITSLKNEIAEYCLLTKTIPEYIDMTIEQYRKFEYISTKPVWTTFRGIPIYVQGKPLK